MGVKNDLDKKMIPLSRVAYDELESIMNELSSIHKLINFNIRFNEDKKSREDLISTLLDKITDLNVNKVASLKYKVLKS